MKVYGGLQGLRGGGLSLGRAWSPEGDPVAMITCEASGGDIFNVFLPWDETTALQRDLHDAVEGVLIAPAQFAAYRDSRLEVAPTTIDGVMTITGTNWEDQRLATISVDTAHLLAFLSVLVTFLEENEGKTL